jgi:hypothetical protein
LSLVANIIIQLAAAAAAAAAAEKDIHDTTCEEREENVRTTNREKYKWRSRR